MIPTTKTKLYTVIGWPLSHTLSPALHNPLFEKAEIDAMYLAFEIPPEKFNRKFIDSLKYLNFQGFNLTLPYKKRVIEFLDECDREAEQIGAVNTVINKNNKLIGYNTDDIGFYRALLSSFPEFKMKDSKILILGAGGAAFSVAWSCLKRDCKLLIIANRTKSNADKLKKNLKRRFKEKEIITFQLEEDILSKIKESLYPDLIINATSYGLKKEKKSLVDFSFAERSLKVMDLIYRPKTAFLYEAEKRRLKTADGLLMLVYQGIEAFKIWTGITPDAKETEKRLRNLI